MTDIARHWIDGQWQASERVAESTNPSTGTVLGRFADGGESEARAAVAAARRAVWTNAWFVLNDGFAEGGFKSSGIGRLRGPLATAFSEAKTYVQVSPSNYRSS